MDNKALTDAKVYTDVQSLDNLRYEAGKNSSAAKKEVAQQFEAILMQMVMNSMREATNAVSSDLFSSNEMGFYQDMFDKQMSMNMADGRLGFAKLVEKFIDDHAPSANSSHSNKDDARAMTVNAVTENNDDTKQLMQLPETNKIVQTTANNNDNHFKSPEDFIKSLLPKAKAAAKLIGTTPDILLAQAALETNWGKKIVPQNQSASSYNLFNIKADATWDKKIANATTLEQQNGVLVKEKATFRSYDSFMDSFMDYVHFLKQNTRYSGALMNAANPAQFIQSLQQAGFATDRNYADKILKIFSSHTFKKLIAKVEQNI